MKMTSRYTLIGLTIFALFLQSGLTIKVPLTYGPYRNAAPVPVQNLRQSSRHQIYEIHHHYVTPSHQYQQQQPQVAHAHHSGQGYTAALQQKQEIRTQHANHAPSQHANQGDVDISYLSFAAADGPNGQQITVAENLPSLGFKGPDYLPPVRQHDSYRAPDYLPPHGSAQVQHSAAHHQQHANIQAQQQYGRHSAVQHVRVEAQNAGQHVLKGSDYLPPHNVETSVSNDIHHRYNLVDEQHQHQQHVVQHPQVQQHEAQYQHVQQHPVQQHQVQQHPAQQHQEQHQQIGAHEQHVQTQQHPVQQHQVQQHHAQQHHEHHQQIGAHEQHVQTQQYVQQHVQQHPVQQQQAQQHHAQQHHEHHQQIGAHEQHVQTQQHVQQHPVQQHQVQQHHAQQHHEPHQQIGAHEQHVQTQQPQAARLHFKAPDYLPPNAVGSGSQSFRAPDYLPPVNQFVNPEGGESSTAIVHHVQHQQKQQQAQQVYQQQHVQEQQHIEQHYHVQQQQQQNVEQQPYVQPQQQHHVQPQQQYPVQQQQHVKHYAPQARQVEESPTSFAELPPGYEFQKPDNAEQAIAQLHTLPEPEPQVQTFQQPAITEQNHQQQHKVNDYEQQQQTTNNGYLPPHAHTVSSSNHHQQQQQQQFVQQDVAVPYQAPAYLPPATIQSHAQQPHQQQVHYQNHQQKETQLHSLSSYMNTVQPNERYGASHYTTAPRRPFAEYGPPQHESNPIAPQPLQVAPMYREQSSLPQYYASGMSYQSNPVPQAYTTYTTHQHKHVRMNEETRQSLQKFMPKDIQQQVVAAATGKVRTVQIANSNVVKTLKVLETADDAGVKTIKILGHTNEDPMGDHKVVRVVSPSNVHTVKIFNDEQDVKLADTQSVATAVTTVANKAYLPPAANDLSKKRAVRDSRNTLSQPLKHGRPRRAIILASL